jgi:hypothetical protein
VPTSNPTLIAIAWGFMATWWFGLLMGTFISIASTLGKWQPLMVRDLLRPGAVLFTTAAIVALIAGIIGYFVAKAEIVYLLPSYYDLIPAGKHARFIADLWAHRVVYCRWRWWIDSVRLDYSLSDDKSSKGEIACLTNRWISATAACTCARSSFVSGRVLYSASSSSSAAALSYQVLQTHQELNPLPSRHFHR